MNKESHIGMTYANEDKITKKINDPHFKVLSKISDETYEVFSSKLKIKWIFLDAERGSYQV